MDKYCNGISVFGSEVSGIFLDKTSRNFIIQRGGVFYENVMNKFIYNNINIINQFIGIVNSKIGNNFYSINSNGKIENSKFGDNVHDLNITGDTVNVIMKGNNYTNRFYNGIVNCEFDYNVYNIVAKKKIIAVYFKTNVYDITINNTSDLNGFVINENINGVNLVSNSWMFSTHTKELIKTVGGNILLIYYNDYGGINSINPTI